MQFDTGQCYEVLWNQFNFYLDRNLQGPLYMKVYMSSCVQELFEYFLHACEATIVLWIRTRVEKIKI
jgi:hypothetical protein